jgi:maltose alpha-D-glucosyltransferase/alpha-amylase
MVARAIDRKRLEEQLPAYLATRRWFRAKTRTVQQLHVVDVVQLPQDFCICVLEIIYGGEGRDIYLLPLNAADQEAFDEGAFADERFRNLLLESIREARAFKGQRGSLVAARTAAFAALPDAYRSPNPSFVSRAEQSNTSIIFRDRFILKLFRQIEPGINPDLEIGHFLTRQHFAHTPALLGSLEYRMDGDGASYAAGMLQQFVKNEGDAWKYTLDSLAAFFAAARKSGAAPHEASGLLDPYLASVRLLGRRTAEMHTALSAGTADRAFAPEPYTPSDGARLSQELSAQAAATCALLRERLASLSGTAAHEAEQVLANERRIQEKLAEAADSAALDVLRIRLHGDYHLGQVLFTGDDFMIIDFEGEPARPLSERRRKGLALRDAGGMVRSFQYAAYAALFAETAETPPDDSRQALDPWAAFWYEQVSAAYLEGYFAAAGEQRFLPAGAPQRKALLDAFLLHKALYEVGYELNNRPDWVLIPLRGILSLIA